MCASFHFYLPTVSLDRGMKHRQRRSYGYQFIIGALAVSANTSFGNRYSSPAGPKSTRISLRPKFSTSLTKVPCRGKRTPVFCDRISFVVLTESPVFIVASWRQLLPIFPAMTSIVLSLCYRAIEVIFPRSQVY